MTLKHFFSVAALCLLAACGGNEGSDGGYAVDGNDPNSWEIGPFINGENYSKGMPVQPAKASDGIFTLELTTPEQQPHYVTMPSEPLAGRSKIIMTYKVELAEGAKIVPVKNPLAPSIISLYFQRKGDSWTAKDEAFRWYAAFANHKPINAGEYTLEAQLDGNWTSVLSSSRTNNPDAFREALENTGRVGFVLGGGDGLGHGVYAEGGAARIVVTSFRVE